MINHPSTRPVLIAALALTIGVLASAGPALAQSAASDGQKLAFDRGKGNCLTCHVIKGGDLPGTIGPELKNIKSKYPDRNDLAAMSLVFPGRDVERGTPRIPCSPGVI